MFILEYYQNEPENVREPEVIDFAANIVNKLDKENGSIVTSNLLQNLLNSTLPMITQDYLSFPDHRTNFFSFIKAIVERFFESNIFT